MVCLSCNSFQTFNLFIETSSDPWAIANLTGIARDATHVLLSWKSPPCPNGPIIGYNVYYRRINHTQLVPIDSTGYSVFVKLSRNSVVSTIIEGFTPAESYAFHVRALSSNNSEPGLVSGEILITMSSQVVLEEEDLQAIVSRIKGGSRDLTIGLPSLLALESVGITNVV